MTTFYNLINWSTTYINVIDHNCCWCFWSQWCYLVWTDLNLDHEYVESGTDPTGPQWRFYFFSCCAFARLQKCGLVKIWRLISKLKIWRLLNNDKRLSRCPCPPIKDFLKCPYYNKRQQFISIFFAYLSVFNYLGNPSNLIMNTFLVSTCFYIIIEFRCPAEFLYLYREFGGNLWIRDGRGQLACDLADSAPALEYFKQYLGKWLCASRVVFIPWRILQRTLCPWWVWAGWQYDMQSEDPGSMTYVTLRFPRNSSILYCSKSLRLVLIKVQFSSDRLTHMIKMHGSIAILQYWNPLNLYSLYHLIIWK